MKKYVLMAVLIAVNFVFQTSLYNYISIFGVIPSISLILVVIFAMLTDNITGSAVGIFTGILYDTVMYDVFGIYTLIFFIIGAVIGTYSEELNRENVWIYIIFVFAASIFMHVMMYLILFFMRVNMDGLPLIMGKIILEILLNTALAAAVFKFVIYIFNKLNIKLINR